MHKLLMLRLRQENQALTGMFFGFKTKPGKFQERNVMRKNSGFTIMELAVVIALIGILAAIAVPAFVNWLPNFRLTNGVNHIHAVVQDARLQAVKENGRVAVLLDPDGDGSLDGNYLVFIDDDLDWNLDGGETVLAEGEVRDGVQVSGTGFTNDRFGFNSRGLLVVNGSTITLSNTEGRTKTVTIEITGNARIN